jgi:hypothetical protein
VSGGSGTGLSCSHFLLHIGMVIPRLAEQMVNYFLRLGYAVVREFLPYLRGLVPVHCVVTLREG